VIAWLRAGAAAANPPVGPAPPSAAPAAPDPRTEQARDAFLLAIQLTKRGQWVEALAEFERSSFLRPNARTTYDIAYCERALGRLTRAKKHFLAALSMSEGELAESADEARGYLAEIESRLSRALITVAPGTAVAVDGRPLEVVTARGTHVELVAGTRDPGPGETVPASKFHLVLDPGTHVIVVSAPGIPDEPVTRSFAAGETVPLALGVAPPPPAKADPLTPPAKASPALTQRRAGAVAAFVMGGLGLTGAAVFGGLAVSKKQALDAVCHQTCSSTAQPSVDALTTFANASTIGTVVAGVGAALGITLWVTGGRVGQPAGTAALSLGPGAVRMHVAF
jgi:hypothetical protein